LAVITHDFLTLHRKEETMRYKQLTLTSLCVVLMASGVMAKGKQAEKSMDPEAMKEVYMKLATPGEQHKQLAGLAGSWTIKTKEWMEPNKPPAESTGSAEMKMLLDGRFLQQEVTGQMMGQPFSGIEITAYDNLLKRYVTTWMSTMGTGIFMMEGTASPDGKTVTLKGQHPEPGGGYMKHRAIWKILDSNTQTFEMYGAHHGGKEWKMMEMTYTRNSIPQ
jgi:hypothetical protein